MKQRCCNPNHPRFKDWGGRGIKVCDRWRDSFEAFLADMGRRPPGTTLDRKDNDGNYEPGNCRWATSEEQSMNKRGLHPEQLRRDVVAFVAGGATPSEASRRFRIPSRTAYSIVERDRAKRVS